MLTSKTTFLRVLQNQVSAELVMELANTICPYLQMEVDFPSRSPTGWMPILNLQVRMADDNTVDFKWYGKPMSSPFSILNRSAMPPSVKRITLVQMGVTMLRNTRPELHNELRVSMMEQLATKMMISGYPADFRRGVIESAVKCYEAQLAASVSGEKPLYRPRTWQQEGRRQKKMVSKMAWFRPADTVLRVPFTPDSELAKGVRAVVDWSESESGQGRWRPLEETDHNLGPWRWKTLPSRQLPFLHNGGWQRRTESPSERGSVFGRVQALSPDGGWQHGGKILGRVRRFWILPHS